MTACPGHIQTNTQSSNVPVREPERVERDRHNFPEQEAE